MTIQYGSHQFLSFQDYISANARKGVDGVSSTPLYAHPVDDWIIRTLNATAVKSVMKKAIDALVSFQFGHEITEGVVIDCRSFADLFELLAHCAKTLNISIPHAVARPGAELNAFTAGTDDYAFIVISSSICHLISKEEAHFIIGHECGHIAAGHAMYHTLVQTLTGAIANNLGLIGNLVRSTAGLPLLAWSRRAEITADRAGLLCCGDLEIAQKALLRLVIGIADTKDVNLETYLRRAKSIEEYHKFPNQFREIFSSHPQIPKRLEALRLFAESELYYTLAYKTKPASKKLLHKDELDRLVNKLVQP